MPGEASSPPRDDELDQCSVRLSGAVVLWFLPVPTSDDVGSRRRDDDGDGRTPLTCAPTPRGVRARGPGDRDCRRGDDDTAEPEPDTCDVLLLLRPREEAASRASSRCDPDSDSDGLVWCAEGIDMLGV
eukprot:m.133487 g.133487  ORF g.133487 m.133487 type:complete len:129 (-) comp16888_c1_seq2:101-487(-)